MPLMRTSNPTLKENTFARTGTDASGEVMTLHGTVARTAFLLALALASGAWTWSRFATAGPAVMPWLWTGLIGGLILALATTFVPRWAPLTAPLYALCEGLLLGAISAFYEARYGGIVLQAVGLTFGTLICLLAAYASGLIQVTEKFKLGVVAATGAICLIYVANMILGFFGIHIPGIFGNGLVGLGFSAVVVAVAALNLVLDFDFIERGARAGAPKYMEWYGAFALLVTLVWLYLELLRLLSKARSRD